MTDLQEIRTMDQSELLTRLFHALKGYEEIQEGSPIKPGEPSRMLVSIVEEGFQDGSLDMEEFRTALEEAVKKYDASLDEAIEHIAHIIIKVVHQRAEGD